MNFSFIAIIVLLLQLLSVNWHILYFIYVVKQLCMCVFMNALHMYVCMYVCIYALSWRTILHMTAYIAYI